VHCFGDAGSGDAVGAAIRRPQARSIFRRRTHEKRRRRKGKKAFSLRRRCPKGADEVEAFSADANRWWP